MTADRLAQALRDIDTVLRVEGMDLELGSRRLLKEVQSAIREASDAITAPSPAEGDAGLTDEQATALAAFYDVSPGTVRDIYALSKPKAAPNPQPKGTAVDLTDDDIITELHRHTQRYTDDRLDYIIDPSEAVAFARAAIAADRALQATAPAMHSTALAGLILTHLGYSTEPSLEPGADMRRDALARRLGEWLSPATQAPAPAPGTATFGALKAVTAEKNKLNRALELACGYLTEAQVAEIAALMPEGDVLRAPAVAPALTSSAIVGVDYERLVTDAWALHKYRRGTPTCIAFKRGAEWQAVASKPPVHSTGDGNA